MVDVEALKDDQSSEDGSLVVYTDVFCKIADGLTARFFRRLKRKNDDSQVILNGACGALRPGRLTFILGPSGAGKTTLLKILAGRKKDGVKGCLVGAGRESVLVAQHATLLETLTGNETLHFAASLKLSHLSSRDRLYTIQNVSKQLGIEEALQTRVCYMSGGEMKRLSIACELLTDPTVMLLDEPTSGLDSVSSMSVIRALQNVARSGRTVACVLHQPSSKLYASADDVILLAGGRTLYAGAIQDAPDAFMLAGFVCPQYYNMADFIIEVASGEHVGNLKQLEQEAKSYACEMKKISKNDLTSKFGHASIQEAEALLQNKIVISREGYSANIFQQLGCLLWRCSVGAMRDVHLTQMRLGCHVVVALLLGALYSGAGADAARVTSNTACLFFFLLFLFFSNAMPTIHTFPVEATVVLQEHLNKWYSLSAYCISKVIADLPVQILCATLFVIPAWVLTSQPVESERMILIWVVCVLVTILAQTFGLVIGAACGVKLGLFVVPAANIPMLMFSEFFIPYREMPFYLRPLALVSYFRYAFDACIQTVYGFDRPILPCDDVYCPFKKPSTYINYLGLNTPFQHDIIALIIWIVILQVSLLLILLFKVYKSCR